MARILVTEEIAEGGLDRLRHAGHEVDVRLGLSPEELLDAVPGAAAVIIRSATQVTAEALAAGTELMAVGRAGIGLDNVDVAAATARGVMVVNAAAVEHRVGGGAHDGAAVGARPATFPRRTWRSSTVVGSAASGGCRSSSTRPSASSASVASASSSPTGRRGSACASWRMTRSCRRTVARQMGVELLDLDQVVAESDFLTVHLPKTPETLGLINRDLLVKAKPSLRIINVAAAASCTSRISPTA